MSKLLTIFAGVALWLLYAGMPLPSYAGGEADGEISSCQMLSQDSRCLAELSCEQLYNSNLRLPSVENSVSPQSVVCHRPAVCMARIGIKCGVALGRGGDTVCVAEGYVNKPEISPHAVDYYVYSLRRLII